MRLMIKREIEKKNNRGIKIKLVQEIHIYDFEVNESNLKDVYIFLLENQKMPEKNMPINNMIFAA